jgi:peptidyl-prolyl cis-trans isomerase A (cyclophilin A)
MCFIERLLLSALLLLPTTLLADDAGIFADFTTNHGDFTVQLDYEAAPMTVANFVGLAEGSRPWVDPNSGRIKQNVPFYDGLIFHRVISGFMNQGGCPLGTGTGGPGYRFRDEINNGLLHLPYVISMANSGANTNGSQFFITVTPQPNLDGGHTVFGAVVDGQDTIDAINTVDTGENDIPLDPVVIESVTIRRVGAEAEAFDIHSTPLANVSGVRGEIAIETEGSETNIYFNVTEDRPAPSYIRAYGSTDLKQWAPIGELYSANIDWVGAKIGLGLKSEPKAFYNFVRADYPDYFPSSETRMANSTLVFNQGDLTITYHFDETGTGGEGTIHDGLETTPFIIQEHINNSKFWEAEWITGNDDSSYRGILGWAETVNGNILSGPSELYIWDWEFERWNFISTGTFTLTLP